MNRAQNICRHVVQRTVDRRHYVADSRKMKDVPGVSKEGIVWRQRADVFLLEDHLRIVPMVIEVQQPAAGQIVNHVNPKSFRDQKVNHMTADKTGAARHYSDWQRARHASASLLTVFTFTYSSFFMLSVNLSALK